MPGFHHYGGLDRAGRGKTDIGVDRDCLARPHVDRGDAHLPVEGRDGLSTCASIVSSAVARRAGRSRGPRAARRAASASTSIRISRTGGTITARFSLQTTLYWRILRQAPCVELRLELMDDTTTLGAYLRAERERRELALRTISETTRYRCRYSKASNPTTSHVGPAGSFAALSCGSYAEAVGLDPDDIFKRFERQHRACRCPISRKLGRRRLGALAQAAGVADEFLSPSPRAKRVISALPPTWPSP